MLNWAIIGSGDVVQRLVSNSLFINTKSSVTYVVSDNLEEARKYGNKHKIKLFIINQKET